MKPSIFFVFICLSCFSSAQQAFIPQGKSNYLRFSKEINQKGFYLNESFKPYLESRINLNIDSLNNCNYKRKNRSNFGDKIKREDLIWVKKNNFSLRINPLFNLSYTQDVTDTSLRADTSFFYQNSRGIEVQADINEKVTIYTAFMENQAVLPYYQDEFVKRFDIVPGQGRVKVFKNKGYDFAMSNAYVSFSPINNLNLKFGHGKNSVGNGYRSLLLSDNTFNYPHLSINSLLFGGKFNYINTYASLQSLDRVPTYSTVEAPFIKKQATFHYLNIHLGKNVQLGFFEGIIWQRWDSLGTIDLNPQSLLPIIGFNSVLFQPKKNTNALYGLNLLVKVTNTLNLYGQIAIDDLNQNKQGYQLGARYFDVAKISNLNIQFEWNQSNPNNYGHNLPLQNYSHYNQPLAHPFGGGFDEMLVFLNYNVNDFYFQFRWSSLKANSDSIGTYIQSDVFLPYADVKNPIDLIENKIEINSLKIGYILNRKTNMRIELGYFNRNRIIENNDNSVSQLFTVSFKTDLFNYYFDF